MTDRYLGLDFIVGESSTVMLSHDPAISLATPVSSVAAVATSIPAFTGTSTRTATPVTAATRDAAEDVTAIVNSVAPCDAYPRPLGLEFIEGGKSLSLPKTQPRAVTFASIVGGSSDAIDPTITSHLPIPEVRGDMIYVKISEDLYYDQLQNFRTNLIGRLLLRKGLVPMRTDSLKASLAAQWNPANPWHLVPLGKGYFDIHFNSEDDMRRIWRSGTCSLATGIFRLFEWKPDFIPGANLPQTHSQVWIRISGLSQDYWHPRHLMEIARGIGTPLHIDKATKERQFGYYARILVDIEHSQDLPSSLMVEKGNQAFSVNISYENLPHHLKKQEKPGDRSGHEHVVSNRGKKPRQDYRIKATPSHVSHVERPEIEQVASLEHIHVEDAIVNEVPKDTFVPLADQDALVDPASDELEPMDSTVAVLVCPSEPQSVSGAVARSGGNVNVSTSNSFEILAQVQHEPIVSEQGIAGLPSKKFCWGDLENEEPLGNTVHAYEGPLGNTAHALSAVNHDSWFDEGESALDVDLLHSLPKAHRKSKEKQSRLSPRYPARNRTPTVRLNL